MINKLKCMLGFHTWGYDPDKEKQWRPVFRICKSCGKVEMSMDGGQTWISVTRGIM